MLLNPIRVRFKGVELWWLPDAPDEGPLAPLEHCDEKGELKIPECFESDTWGHVIRGRIKRFGEDLGGMGELERIGARVC